MFAGTLSLYKNAYSGLSAHTWWLSLIMLINRSGTMVLPFMTIYLISPEVGYSIGDAGIVMGLFGLGAVVGGYLGGWLTDKIGFFRVQMVALIGGGLLFIVLGQMHSFSGICILSFLLSLVNESFRPANSTAIAYYSNAENRTRSFSLNRLAINLGWAVGSAVGGIIAAHDYELLFWVDGCTNIAAALLMWYLLPPSKVQQKHSPATREVPDPAHSAYKDKVFLWFIVLTILFAACFFQIFNNLTAYYKNVLHFSEQYIGLLNALNGLIITVIEMVLVYKLEGKRSKMYYITIGVLLCGLSYLMLNVFHMNALLAIGMIVLITFGEILAMPFMNSFWIARTANHNRGQYAGLYTIAWSVAQTLGPFLGSQVADHAGWPMLWWLVGGVCLLSCVGFGIMYRREVSLAHVS
ncbi:MFS transporter [Paraflavitalea sp. CAU 1676]|uniref:MDR family MFS transporter n=1 Tax=Paraflavitalea sp. CAU 1676 TaxID=3032598 RepID=UPI0023DB08D0|nr:MFS transporter [Paraflavitalea sp. CAU 1676]MDF2189989.1 MFS transporter [Paraflavitalea sp. CAU 1676]